jgi:hypothetical protein
VQLPEVFLNPPYIRDVPPHTADAGHAASSGVLPPAGACPHLTDVTRRFRFVTSEITGGDLGYDTAFYNSGTTRDVTESPFDAFRIVHPASEYGSLQWFGGTYAAHPQFFPREQSQPDWIIQNLVPLAISPPHRFVHFTQHEWQRQFPWHETLRPGAMVHPNEFIINLMCPATEAGPRRSRSSLAELEKAWTKNFEWFGGMPAECGLHTAAPAWALRHCAPQLAVPSATPMRPLPLPRHCPAYNNQGYARIFNSRRALWKEDATSGVEPPARQSARDTDL